jgi:hypothetical protein
LIHISSPPCLGLAALLDGQVTLHLWPQTQSTTGCCSGHRCAGPALPPEHSVLFISQGTADVPQVSTCIADWLLTSCSMLMALMPTTNLEAPYISAIRGAFCLQDTSERPPQCPEPLELISSRHCICCIPTWLLPACRPTSGFLHSLLERLLRLPSNRDFRKKCKLL